MFIRAQRVLKRAAYFVFLGKLPPAGVTAGVLPRWDDASASCLALGRSVLPTAAFRGAIAEAFGAFDFSIRVFPAPALCGSSRKEDAGGGAENPTSDSCVAAAVPAEVAELRDQGRYFVFGT
eukprot:RCo047709